MLVQRPAAAARRSGSSGAGAGAASRLGFAHFLNAVNVAVRNLPAKITALSPLLDVLFQEDRSPGIRHKRPGSRHENIARAVLYGDLAPQKMRIGGHPQAVSEGVTAGSIVRTGCYA